MSGKSKKEDELLAAIKNTKKPHSSSSRPSTQKASHSNQPSSKPASYRRGRTSSFSFNEEDYRIIRELSAWLAGQGRRVNDTAILRAALRMVETGDELLQVYDTIDEQVREARRKDNVLK